MMLGKLYDLFFFAAFFIIQDKKLTLNISLCCRAENYNTSAVEFLRRLPGVTDSNYRAIMDGCKNLAELALFPIERLAELMGGRKAAQTLRDFLDAKYPTLL